MSTVVPNQVVVVASGYDVRDIVIRFRSRLTISYFHTAKAGQIIQKRMGISKINPDTQWCIFTDDDLLFEANAIQEALKVSEVFERQGQLVAGLGFHLPATSRLVFLSLLTKFIAEKLNFGTKELGKVLRNGHATSYLQSEKIIEVDWLNGASMWRMDIARTYGKNLNPTSYAACEDLIFSYPQRKIGKLIYVPKASLQYQEETVSDFNNIQIMKSAALWRYYFIMENEELSFKAFYISQWIRMFFALRKPNKNSIKMFSEISRTNLNIAFDFLFRKDPTALINQLLN